MSITTNLNRINPSAAGSADPVAPLNQIAKADVPKTLRIDLGNPNGNLLRGPDNAAARMVLKELGGKLEDGRYLDIENNAKGAKLFVDINLTKMGIFGSNFENSWGTSLGMPSGASPEFKSAFRDRINQINKDNGKAFIKALPLVLLKVLFPVKKGGTPNTASSVPSSGVKTTPATGDSVNLPPVVSRRTMTTQQKQRPEPSSMTVTNNNGGSSKQSQPPSTVASSGNSAPSALAVGSTGGNRLRQELRDWTQKEVTSSRDFAAGGKIVPKVDAKTAQNTVNYYFDQRLKGKSHDEAMVGLNNTGHIANALSSARIKFDSMVGARQ